MRAPEEDAADESVDRLTELRLALARNGYRPVPVSGAHLNIKSAGKRPLMRGWETICSSADDDEIARWTRSHLSSTNTGILCGEIVGVDIDVPVDSLSAEVETLAREVLGATPLKRIGRAPKLLLVFRARAPFNKVQTPELVLPDETVVRVEVLATGQQFVGFGLHPDTKAEYHWPDRSPLELPASDLPVVTHEQCTDFVERAEAMLRRAGGESRRERKEFESEGRKAAGLKTREKPSRELVAAALGYVPNHDVSYDEWIRVGFALYDGLGNEGHDLWDSWSAQSAKNHPAVTAAKWPSFAQGRSITVGTLFWLAQQNGWRRTRPQRERQPRGNPYEGIDRGSVPSGRPIIKVVAGDLPRVVDQGEDAIIAAELSLYQRGSMIVRPTVTRVANADGRWTMAQRLVQVRTHHIAEAMTFAANWERFDARCREWVSMDCSLRVAETYVARDGLWRLPVLTALINCPTLRADGSILDAPGYDQATGLLFDPQGATFPPITPEPTRNEALLSLRILHELIATFPFVSKADRAVALSAILTTLIRHSLPTAPLHGFTSPTAGSGKSMLGDITSYIASGRPASVIAQGKTEEEMEKRLGAAFIAGDPLVSIDNCESPLGGQLLCQALTQQMLKVRILGKSVNAEVLSNATILATGNNLTLSGDMTRRAIVCSLDPGVERPELRNFDRDPVATVQANRGTYVAAALTVMRAFHIAGRPKQTTPLGSFTDWSHWVRDALVWLGEADPCATMEDVRFADPKLRAMSTVFAQWHAVLGPARVSVKEVIDAAVATDKSNPANYVHPEFREVLVLVAGEDGEISSRRLGKWISGNRGRIVGGMKLEHDGMRAGVTLWRLARSEGGFAHSSVA